MARATLWSFGGKYFALMSSTTEKIKEKLSIVDVVGSYIPIEKSGANLKARCPFHNEKTPSFYISPDRGSYYCFGCGAKGDIFSFVQDFESIDFVGALKMLAERAGVPLDEFKKTEKNETSEILEALEEACIYFQNNLKEETEALLYLKNRGLLIQSVNSWRVGFAKSDWRTLKNYLKSRGLSEEILEKAGLIKKAEGKESYDRFRGRIMFPIFDSSGRVIGFSGRILKSDNPDEAKYLNSPETLVFEKSKLLYGYNFAKKVIRERSTAVLVEGQMDLLMSHQAGVLNTVASSGTAFTEEQAEILKRGADTLVIAYDADKAGQNASLRAWQIALKTGLVVKVAELPEGSDPADEIKKDSEAYKKKIESAPDVVSYFVGIMKSKDQKEKDLILKEKILPLAKSIRSPIDRSRTLEKISFASGVPTKALEEELDLVLELDTSEKDNDFKIKVEKFGTLRKVRLMRFFLETKKNDFKDEFEEVFFDLLPAEKYLKVINPEEYSFESEMYYADSKDIKSVANELLYLLEEEVLKKELEQTMERIRILEKGTSQKEAEDELLKCQEISKKLSNLRKKYSYNL